MSGLEFDENGKIVMSDKIKEDLEIQKEVKEMNDGKSSRKLERKLRKKRNLDT